MKVLFLSSICFAYASIILDIRSSRLFLAERMTATSLNLRGRSREHQRIHTVVSPPNQARQRSRAVSIKRLKNSTFSLAPRNFQLSSFGTHHFILLSCLKLLRWKNVEFNYSTELKSAKLQKPLETFWRPLIQDSAARSALGSKSSPALRATSCRLQRGSSTRPGLAMPISRWGPLRAIGSLKIVWNDKFLDIEKLEHCYTLLNDSPTDGQFLPKHGSSHPSRTARRQKRAKREPNVACIALGFRPNPCRFASLGPRQIQQQMILDPDSPSNLRLIRFDSSSDFVDFPWFSKCHGLIEKNISWSQSSKLCSRAGQVGLVAGPGISLTAGARWLNHLQWP